MVKNMHKTNGSFKKFISMLLVVLMLVSVLPMAASAENETAAASFENVSGDGKDIISLAEGRDYKAMIPVSETVDASAVTWTMVKDESKTYVSKQLFPNQTEGGALSTWLCDDGETPFFGEVTTSVVTEDGQSYLVAEFGTNDFFYGYNWWTGETYADNSAPHDEGGAYLDSCGYFNLTATDADGKVLGSVPVKIAPYDNFHTMDEIYTELDEMVAAAAKSDIFVKKYSMGSSSGDIYAPLDMPYLIVAKDSSVVTEWLQFTEKAETQPEQVIADIKAGKYDDIKVPVMFSNIHANEVAAADGVMEFAWMLINAATSDGKLSYNNLTGFTAEGKAEFEAEKAEQGMAIPDLVKDTATYLGWLTADNRSSGIVDLEKFYTQETVNTTVDELLSDVFFVLVPEENVEGRTYVTREASNGYDLNRDNSFQTTEETQNMQKLIATFNPVSLTEFHGRVSAFQCEPCDPPHEPNFEYDLLAEHLIAGGEALGIAAVANNDTYNSYVIPQRDYLSDNGDGTTYWSDPWDDMSTSYTPQFAMLQGTVAYTVELPGYNNAGSELVQYGCLGQSNYIGQEKLGYLLSQTEIFKRGVNNFNSDAFELVGQWLCDQNDVEGAESDLFRPEFDGEGENGNFYPECYIIPLDAENQTNLQAAGDMMVWLSRNDVKVLVTDKEFTYDGVTYPAGTMIVSMYQAKRSVANGVLYDGTLISNWTVLYSEGITTFNETRGFDMATVTEPAAYKTIKAACGDWMDYDDCVSYKAAKLGSAFDGVKDAYVVISNASEDSTAAVNALLKAGKTVGMVTDEDSDFYGDFVCAYADWQSVCAKYVLTGTGLADADVPAAKVITAAPTVYLTGEPQAADAGFVWTNRVYWSNSEWNYDRVALELMGFNTTKDLSKATLIMGANELTDTEKAAVLSGTAYIGYNYAAESSPASPWSAGYSTIFGDDLVVSNAEGFDCLGYVTYPETTLVNASYVMDGDDVMYMYGDYGPRYFSEIPEGATVLVKTDGSKTPTEGFIQMIEPEQKAAADEFLNGSIQAISFQGKLNETDANEVNVVFFANTLTHKVHQRDEYAFISNFAFSSLLGGDFLGGSTEPAGDLPFVDVEDDAWYLDSVKYVYDNKLMLGDSDTTFNPDGTMNRAMFATVIYRMAGSPSVEGMKMPFTDVDEKTFDWAYDAIVWAFNKGVTKGVNDTEFAPDKAISRAELVTMLYRYTGSPEVSGTLSFADASAIDEWAQPAAIWASGNGVVQGMPGGKFAPNDTATRAQMAVILDRYCNL